MVAFPLRIRAVFLDGKFVPTEPCALPEKSEVELTVEPSQNLPPTVTDARQREQLMRELLARMTAASLASNAPRLSRDELHERR